MKRKWILPSIICLMLAGLILMVLLRGAPDTPDGYTDADVKEWMALYRHQNELGDMVKSRRSAFEYFFERVDSFSVNDDGTVDIHLSMPGRSSPHSYRMKKANNKWVIYRESR